MTNPVALAIVSSSNALGTLIDRARGYAADAKSDATRLAYRTGWRLFEAWCDGNGICALPATPASIATYLASMADSGRKVATIERALAAIAHEHRANGHPWTKGSPVISEVLKGIRRRVGVAQAKKAPVVDEDLRALVRTLGDGLAGLRDRALLTLAWFGAFRRSEVVALTVEDVIFGREGLIVTLKKSKTDQEAHGLEKGIPYAGDPAVCPVRALREWLDAAQIATGPLFRAVSRGERLGDALGDKAVARIVKRAARSAGLDDTKFAGHSLRAGFITTAARKGKSLDAIMRQSAHKSERIARGYIRHGTLFSDNAAVGLL